MTETKYTGVKTLEGLAGMRAKPAMYLGSTGVLQKGHAPRALTQMAQEVISNSLDETLAGFGKVVKIIVDEDSAMTVIDEGRGLPKGPDDSFDDVIRAATAPHTSGKFDDDSYAGQNTTGTHGIGIKATNAISTKMIIEAICSSTTMKKDQKVLDGGLVHYRMEFKQEKVLSAEEIQRWTKQDLDNMEESERPKTGTKVQFWPDEAILESIVWTNNDLEARLEASAFLFPGVEIIYTDNRSDYHKSWKYEDGLASYIKKITNGEMLLSKLQDPIAIEQLSEVDGYTFKVSAALTYTEDANETTATYANGVPTKEGGPHQDGFYAGLVKAVNDFAIAKHLIKRPFRQSDVTEGLIAALHVQVPSKIMEFEGQTKEKLATVQAKAATQQAIFKAVSDWMYDNLDAAAEIVEKTEMSRQAREAAAKSRKEAKAGKDAKKKKRLEISSKLKQASSKDSSKCELIITEGDSASNVKRDKSTQAILGLRGKIKNAFEVSLAEAVKNNEISTIIGAIGAGVGSDCDPERSNYGGGIYLACFDGETKVKSLDGKSYSFNELIESNTKELWVYAMDSNGRVVPALAKNIRKTGDRSKMVRVTLDNGEVVESTPEHLFMTVEGRYVEAQNLRAGQSLMPLYTKIDENGYELFYSQADGKYECTHRMIAEYNQSNAHSIVVTKTNASKEYIDPDRRSKILMSVRFLIDHNLPVDEYHYDMYRNISAMKFSNALKHFGSTDIMIEEALKTKPREFEHAKDFRFSYDNTRKQKNQIAKVVRKILDENEVVTADRYNAEKGSRTPRFDRALEKFGSYENLVEYASNYNHKVVSIETVEYDETKPVYCMTVPEYHNFFLDSGVLVKNCDADDDGCHICTLLLGLFYKFMRKLIESGKIYVIVPPLYKAEKYVKGKPEIKMYFTEQELAADRSNLSGYSIQRYKGLGEMDKDTEAYDAITNAETRRVVQVTIDDAMRAARMLKVLLGNDSTLRSEWIENTIDFDKLAYN